MSKTLLIAIGLLAAQLTAAGIIYYNPVNTARRQLYDKDPQVRFDAIVILYKDRASFPRMRQLLYGEDISVAMCAATFLNLSRDKENIPDFRNLLNNEESVLREEAILALWHLGDKESIPTIKKLLNDEDMHVSQAAEEALKKLGVPESEIAEIKERK